MNKIFLEKLKKIEKSFFSPNPEQSPWILRIWWAILFLSGVYLWVKFFNVNNGPLNFHDWYQITVPRIDFIRQSLISGVLPLHASNDLMLHGVTDRFLALPDVITTPQMLLLLFVDIPTYVLLDVLIHFSIAFVSLLWLQKKYKLSMYISTILFLLFNFNGYILSHYSVGHFSWGGYFLFPLFFILVFELIDGNVTWIWITKMSFLLFYIVLAGSQHHYIWLIIFLGVLALVQWKQAHKIIAAVFFSGMLASIRLLPPALELAAIEKKAAFNYVLGYPSIMELLFSMAILRRPRIAFDEIIFFQTDTIIEYYWEFNYYVGILGLAFILFGLALWLKEKKPTYWQLITPCITVFALSLGSTYRILRMTNLPLLLSERVTSRMISVPMTFFIIIAAIYIQKWLSQQQFSAFQKILLYASLVLMGIEIYTSVILWRISESATYFGSQTLETSLSTVTNHPDPLYEMILLIGLTLGVFTAAFLAFQVLRERRKTI